MSLTAKTTWAIAALSGACVAASPAMARDFSRTSMDLFFGAEAAPGTVRTAGVNVDAFSDPARDLADRTFTELDIRIVLRSDNQEDVRRMVDQGYAAEPSGCAPGGYGPLDMEDGLRYFFDLDTATAEDASTTRVTVYPGNRATHWTNDVFCEFDPGLGEDAAVLRISGFFYAIHRAVEGGVDVQLRAVTLTPDEVERYAVAGE